MPSLDLQWQEGDVGDWWLRVGRISKIIHIYQNPWSPLWIIEGASFGLDKEPYAQLAEAKLVAELSFRDWLDGVLYKEDDDVFIFGDINIDPGC